MVIHQIMLNFVEQKHIPKYKPRKIKQYEKFLNEDLDMRNFSFDSEYLDYLKIANGRLLKNCWFKDQDNSNRQIQRIFSFIDEKDIKPTELSWRGGGEDIQLDYSIPFLETVLPNWEVSLMLVPFAGVDNEQSSCFDMLCFDYRFIPRPLIVLWEHEENAYEDPECACLQFVARDFSHLQNVIYEMAQ